MYFTLASYFTLRVESVCVRGVAARVESVCERCG